MTAVDGCDPHLAVADLAGAGRLDDGVGVRRCVIVVDEHLDADLRDEVDRVLRASIDLGVAALASEAAGFADGHASEPRTA